PLPRSSDRLASRTVASFRRARTSGRRPLCPREELNARTRDSRCWIAGRLRCGAGLRAGHRSAAQGAGAAEAPAGAISASHRDAERAAATAGIAAGADRHAAGPTLGSAGAVTGEPAVADGATLGDRPPASASAVRAL